MADVILVDDDALYREVLSADLNDHGFAVSCFADGPSFLEALDNGAEARVALLDWSLPQMSGLDLLDAMRERAIGLPVVFLTGYAAAERELQALDRGAVDFVDKARETSVLVQRLRLIIGPSVETPAATPATTRPAATPAERHGDLTLQTSIARALWQQRDADLTMTEFKIVAQLASHRGEVQSYRALYDVAHYVGFAAGAGERGHETNVRSLLKRIRRKFHNIDAGFSEIENVPHVGYRWRAPES